VGAGILSDRAIRALSDGGKLISGRPLDADQIQPASLDLRLGAKAYRVRASFLPGPASAVEDKLARLSMHEIDLSAGAVLETGCVYIVPLLESLTLPREISASANPKSSTGRLDIFHPCDDRFRPGVRQDRCRLCGPLWLEVSPRTFPIVARTGSRLSQIRFRQGQALLDETELLDLHSAETLVASDNPNVSGGGIALSIDLAGQGSGQPGWLPRQAPHGGDRCRQARRPGCLRFLGADPQSRLGRSHSRSR
jgi:dCTP deaminase